MEAGEGLAAEETVGCGDAFKFVLLKDEMVEFFVESSPDDVFEDAVAAINAQLLVQVVAGRSGGDLND